MKSREPTTVERVARAHPSYATGATFDPATLTLRDAQLTLAGSTGSRLRSTHVGEQMVDQRDLHRWFDDQLNNEMWKVIEDENVGPGTPSWTGSGCSTPL